jgi:hypothetical protein
MLAMKRNSLCASLFIVALVLSFTCPETGHAILSPNNNSGFVNDANSSANLTSAGTSSVAISGEPAHAGDTLSASILISNGGASSGTASLFLEDTTNNVSYEGSQIEISPGSSREVSTTFSPHTHGQIIYNWRITSIDAPVNESLSGSFEIEAYSRQTLSTTIESYAWTSSHGLELDLSIFLSPGSSREVSLHVSSISSKSTSLLQRIEIELDPGRRPISIDLGSPNSEQIRIEIFPKEWSPNTNSINSTTIQVETPIVDSSILSVEASISPEFPISGESVRISVNLTNSGNISTESGKLRVIRTSDKAILAESSVPSANPGITITSNLEIPKWSESNAEGGSSLDIVWMSGSASTSLLLSVQSTSNDDGITLPFNTTPVLLGTLAGIAIILSGRLVWRAASTKTPSINSEGMRATREEKKLQSRKGKKEVSCPFCEQRLSIPEEHTGKARCPSCSMSFNVSETHYEGTPEPSLANIEEETKDVPLAASSQDLLQCPDCDQTLKVPLDKRPVLSRCPVCKLEFMAELEE